MKSNKLIFTINMKILSGLNHELSPTEVHKIGSIGLDFFHKSCKFIKI